MSELKNIHQRIHAVMGDVEYIQKEKKDGMNYSVVSHDAVTSKVRPSLLEHGVIYYPVKTVRSQDGKRTQVDMIVRFCNVDNPSDFIDVETCGYGDDGQDKGPGKAMSYSVKYAILKVLSLETGDDPDDVHAVKSAQKRATKDQKHVQTMLFNKINQCMDAQELESVIDKHKEEYNDLPRELRDIVDMAYESREAQIKNGTAVIVGEHFDSVTDSRARANELLADMDRCATLDEMDKWEKRWWPTISNLKGQSRAGKDSEVFKQRIGEKREKIFAASKGKEAIGAG